MALPPAIILQPNDGCLTIARALVRRGVDVHAFTNREYAYVLASRGVRGRVMPDPRDDSAAWLGTLRELGADGGGVVLSGSDVATEWLTNHRRQLPDTLRTFESTDQIHLDVMDKSSLYREAAALGIHVPRSIHVRGPADLPAVLADAGFPCVVKASLGHVAKSQAGFGTVLVGSRQELVERAAVLLDNDIDFLVTEVVPGPETLLEGAMLVRRRDGTYALQYSRRKIRQWPTDTGVGSFAVSAVLPETLAMARRLLDHVGFYGIAALETKRHEATGQLHLIEINVRVPAMFGLADACGVDGSWRLYATLAGLPLGPQPAQVDGRKVMIPHRELRSAWQHIGLGDTSLLGVLPQLARDADFGVLSARDPVPTLAFIAQRIRRRFARPRRIPRRVDAPSRSGT